MKLTMRRFFILFFALLLMSSGANAQRFMDNLGRGLVVIPTGSSSNYITWRRLGTEYYDVTYNLYKDGVKIAEGLTTTSYSDSGDGDSDSRYQVAAVVRGSEQPRCGAMSAWTSYLYNSNATGYIELKLADVFDRDRQDVTDHYEPNDAEFADLDGDGELEMIIKRLNTVDAAGVNTGRQDDKGNDIYNIYPQNSKEFVVLDAYKINWQTGAASLMWRIDCGPNMVSSNSTEINIIAFDWDEDGKAEVVLRGADNMIIYGSDGLTRLHEIGNMNANTRQQWYSSNQAGTNTASMAYTNSGAEHLLYLNGETGALYQIIDFPLPRLEQGETDLGAVWGDAYGHRSSKYFLGAPYLKYNDGVHPALYLGRGIYTRHKMVVMNLDKGSHQWGGPRWRWQCYDSNSPWYGNGYHNFIIADVDEDGLDEIIYGSMVIDDNGCGLSTTGFEHGDAQHVGDFNPWRKGLEFFGCLEDYPYWGSNYRDATTSEVLFKHTQPVTYTNGKMDDNDDGRAMMDNLTNNFPGSIGRSVGSSIFSSVTCQHVMDSPDNSRDALYWSHLNFRIYWDGDLCSEILDSPGTARDAGVYDVDAGRLFTSDGCNMNNGSKNNPCFQGDLIGDWREEIVLRSGQKVRIYSSGMSTNYSLPTLWHDHQYRQAMVWQMMAYNQPPHLSYFLGEMEGYTQAPPPQMMNGRTEVHNNGTIGTGMNDVHVIACENNDMTISVTDGASPWVFTDNAPSHVSGSDYNGQSGTKVKTDGSIGVTGLPAINRTSYTHTVTGGAFTGAMHLTKQGDGTLVLPSVTETYTGNTTVWAGTLQFDGTMQSSPVSMKRLTTLNTTGGTFNGGLTMQYGATLNVGGPEANTLSTVSVSELNLEYGARVVLDVNGNGENEHDWLDATTLNVDVSKAGVDTWENYGPEDIVPVFQLNMTSTLGEGRYPIGHVSDVFGDLSLVKVVCDAIPSDKLSLVHDDGILYLQVSSVAIAVEASIEITGMAPYETVSTPYPSTSSADYYLPIVSIVANNTSGITPTLTGTFTALDGTVTNLGGGEEVVLFSENYENTSSVSGWTAYTDVNLSIASGDATHGKYFLLDLGSTNTRYAYKRFSSVDVSNGCSYSLECDFALKPGNRDPNEFCVMSKGGTNPTNLWDNYATINNNANMLFDLTASGTSTTYNVNGTTTTTTLASETWYHLTLNVNQSARTVSWQISNGSSGTFDLPSGTSSEFDGFYVVAGRNYSKVMLDNIVIKSLPEDLSSFTFPEPGTLQVTSSVEGYASGIKTFEVKYPYYKYYGKDFDEITGANIAEVLGNNWNTTAQNTRWANWNKAYGDIYPAYWVVNNSSPINLFNDSDPQVVWMDSNGSYPAAVIEGYGVGRNSNGAGATIHVENCGDSNTLIYYLVDNSLGNAPSTYGGFDEADSDGGYIIAMNANYTLAKLYIYVPVSIHDEMAANLPMETTDGNVHLYRTKLTTASSWSTMVVPFDMTYEQAQEVFGEGVVIANLKENEGDAMNVYFETASKEIHANEPFLIQNVTKEAPYLVMGITSEAVEEPVLQTANFQFIGRYTKPEGGKIIFNTDDYFFDANTGLLSTVKADGTGVKMNGYRAYFHAYNSNSAKNIGLMFIGTNGIGEALPATLMEQSTTVYDLSGRKVMKGNAESAKTLLSPGVYIVNGQKVVIK